MSDIFLSLIVPAFNEERRLGITLEATHSYLERFNFQWELIVVDDGSSDQTSAVVESFKRVVPSISLVRNDTNCGKGYSIRRAVAKARGSVIGFMDADYKTPIEELEKVLPELEAGYHIVIGSRGLPGARMENPVSWLRLIGSRVFGIIMHAIVGLRDIPDTQCGFKFFRKEIALDLFTRQILDGYMFDVEILYLSEKSGYRIKQIPIRWIFDPDSRLRLIRGNVTNMIGLFRIRLNHYPKPRIVEWKPDVSS